jgi:hypothetical protein
MSPVGGGRDVSVEMESRIGVLEQRSATVAAPSVAVSVNPDTGAVEVSDSLTWVSGWESYTQLGGFVADQSDPDYPGGTPSTAYGIAQAYRLANTCFLTGLVRRRTSSLNVNPRWDLPMFMLPLGWRPIANVPLLCAMGSTAPDGTLNTANMAWIEVRPEPAQDAGRVFFVTASAAMTVNTSWVALQGSFPMVITESEA